MRWRAPPGVMQAQPSSQLSRQLVIGSSVGDSDAERTQNLMLFVARSSLVSIESRVSNCSPELSPCPIRSCSFSSVAQLCPTPCNPMDCSTPGLPVHHQLPEFTQTHVHRVGDAIQPSHPLSPPSPPAVSLSQHQGLFQGVSFSHHVVKVLEF